jgi:hypothetical protein
MVVHAVAILQGQKKQVKKDKLKSKWQKCVANVLKKKKKQCNRQRLVAQKGCGAARACRPRAFWSPWLGVQSEGQLAAPGKGRFGPCCS